ncbi:acylphosphatase [archaeon]|nr:acylphosphatase [archaeon]
MCRSRITVMGRIQRVGFRETVQEIARELGVVGEVRNLKTGDVEIIVEGEKRKIVDFIKAIDINDGLIDVKKITKPFEEPTGEFKYFEIKYGELQEEFTESIGAGRRELIAIKETIDSNFEILGEKMDSAGKNTVDVGKKIESGFLRTGSDFKTLDGKYDIVSKELKMMNENISKLVGYVGTLVDDIIEIKKGRE